MSPSARRVALALLLLYAAAGAGPAHDTAKRAAREARAWRERHERAILAELVELVAIPNVARDRANIERNVTKLVAMLESRGLVVRVLRLEGAAPLIVADLRAKGAARTAGSPNLAAYMEKHPDLLRPDAWLICDGPVHQSRRQLLGFGVRGVTSVEVTVHGPVKSPHDGHYGNWIPNPAARLAHLLAGIRDEQGYITIPGILDDVLPPTEAEKRAIAEIPDLEPGLRTEFEVGGVEGGGERLDATLLRPALNIRGLRSAAVGERATNSIPTTARASIDFRLVPAMTTASVRTAFEEHLGTLGWTIVTDTPDSLTRLRHDRLVELDWGGGYPASRTPLDSPLATEVAGVLGAIGRPPVRTPTLGGSLPIHIFTHPHGTPTFILPTVNHDNNQHAPNENLRLQNLWDAVETFAALFAGLGG